MVYGSFARGEANERSDVDIALAGSDPLSLDDKMTIQAELSTRLGRELDVVDLSDAEGIFLHRIMSEGLVVAETLPEGRELRLSLTRRALYFNADYYPIYKRDQEARLRRMFDGGE